MYEVIGQHAFPFLRTLGGVEIRLIMGDPDPAHSRQATSSAWPTTSLPNPYARTHAMAATVPDHAWTCDG